MKNDLSFIISSELNLYEHQSTICPNMPLRGLFYLATQYKGLIADNPNALYSSRLIKLPVPRYIVFYNGETKQPERQILKLSDAFEKHCDNACLECTTEVLNINYGHNKSLQNACQTLCDYAILVEKIRINRKKFKPLTKSINTAVDQCIKEGVLKDFLLKHRGEVTDLILSQYDEEAYIKSEKEISYEDGYQKAQDELQPVIDEQNLRIQDQASQIQHLTLQNQEQTSQLQDMSVLIENQAEMLKQLQCEIDSLKQNK